MSVSVPEPVHEPPDERLRRMVEVESQLDAWLRAEDLEDDPFRVHQEEAYRLVLEALQEEGDLGVQQRSHGAGHAYRKRPGPVVTGLHYKE